MTRNVSLSLLFYAAHRDGHPQAPGAYTLVYEAESTSDESHAVQMRTALAIAAARFDCTPPDAEPEWVESPDGLHRLTWGLDGMGAALVLASAPLPY